MTGVRERQELSFRQASQARDDFAQITDLIRFVHEQTSVPNRADVWRIAPDGRCWRGGCGRDQFRSAFMRLGMPIED